jgi:steroid delta-isomerase-like uncharacterized protein
MSPDENKAILRRALDEIWNKGNMSAADELASAHLSVHTNTPGVPGQASTEQIKQSVTMYRAAFPNLHTTLDDLIAEGDMVAIRFTVTGTHRGALFGIPPTGKEVTVTNITLYRMAEGRVIEQWGVTDSLGLLQQLGITPSLTGQG